MNSNPLKALARVPLLNNPTELEAMSRIQNHLGCGPLYVKRDDCMTLGMGGNKVRSLEFWLGDAIGQKADIIVVAGDPASNQCRLTAAASAKLGLKCLILHSSKPINHPTGNLLLNYMLGAQIEFIGQVTEKERGKIAEETIQALRAQGHRPYLIGDSTIGAAGYIQGAFELYDQSQRREFGLKHIFIPGSMGTTEVGFLIGNILLSLPFIVHIISVEYDVQTLSQRMQKIFDKTSSYLGLKLLPDAWKKNTFIYDQYLGEGYNIPTPESTNAMKITATFEGFFLENTYTSKTFAGMLDIIKNNLISKTEPACFIHTGGLPSLFTY